MELLQIGAFTSLGGFGSHAIAVGNGAGAARGSRGPMTARKLRSPK